MSSGFSYPQPVFKSTIYNPAFYLSLDASGFLTYDYAQTLYLGKKDYRLTYLTGITAGTATQGLALVPGVNNDISGVGALSCSSLTVNGLAINSAPDYVLAIIPVTVANSKALVLNSTGLITSGLNSLSATSLSATNLTGTLQTAAQPYITSLGTLTSLASDGGNISFTKSAMLATQAIDILFGKSGANYNGAFISYYHAADGSTTSNLFRIGINGLSPSFCINSAGNVGIGTQSQAYKLDVNGAVNASSGYYGTLMTATQLNTTSVGTLANLTLDMSGTGLNIPSLKFNGTTFNQTYFINITEGGADPSKAVVLNSTKDFSGIRNLSCSGTITGSTGVSTPSLSCGTITATTLNINPTTLLLRGTTVTSSATELNALAGVSAGTATNSKALVLGSTGNISGINALSAASVSTSGSITASGSINGFLAYGNQTAITTVGPLTELGINNNATTEYLNIKGSGMDYLDGSYTRMLRFIGSNITSVEFQIEVANGTNATGSNATWIGNITNNDLRFGVNNSTSMILTTTGRLGVGTASPSAPLHVPSNNSFTFGTGGSTVYRLRTDGGNTESALGPISYSVSAIFGGYIACTAMAMTSDRRLKKNIQIAPLERIKRLYDEVNVCLYERNELENRQGQEVGLIAQDLVSAHLTDLISVFYRDDVEKGEDPSLEPAKTQLNVDYSRIAGYNMKMIQISVVAISTARAGNNAWVEKEHSYIKRIFK